MTKDECENKSKIVLQKLMIRKQQLVEDLNQVKNQIETVNLLLERELLTQRILIRDPLSKENKDLE